MPATVAEAPFDPAALEGTSDAGIDASHAAEGYVCAVGSGESRLKVQMANGDVARTFDLPSDGEPHAYPLVLGDGAYTLRIMRNTSGDRYVEVFRTSVDVRMVSEFEPYLRPSYYCDYDVASDCVRLARELASGAENEGDVVRAVYTYLADAISYDTDKAAELAGATGYVSHPDETLAAGSGICFDYATLAAAMLRSLGIPCRIVTGTVYPDGVYHAWNMVYIDGSWHTAEVSVDADTWSRIDTTFASTGTLSSSDGTLEYEERYVY